MVVSILELRSCLSYRVTECCFDYCGRCLFKTYFVHYPTMAGLAGHAVAVVQNSIVCLVCVLHDYISIIMMKSWHI